LTWDDGELREGEDGLVSCTLIEANHLSSGLRRYLGQPAEERDDVGPLAHSIERLQRPLDGHHVLFVLGIAPVLR